MSSEKQEQNFRVITLLNHNVSKEIIDTWNNFRTDFYTVEDFRLNFFDEVINLLSNNMKIFKILESGLSGKNREIKSNVDTISERQFCNYDHIGRFGNVGFRFFGVWDDEEIKEISNAMKIVINKYLKDEVDNSYVSAFLVDEIL